jgi:SulP family sulfate permease
VLRDAVDRLEKRGIAVYVSGVAPGHEKALEAIGVLERLRKAGRAFPTTPEAIRAARTHLHRAGILPTRQHPAVLDPA